MTHPPFNLRILADAKKIPLEFLQSLGVSNSAGGRLAIEYRHEDGTPSTMKRYRTSLDQIEDEDGRKRPKFIWDGEGEMIPYGLWRLANSRSSGQLGNDLFFVEGESDCWAGWHHGMQVLGIPGAANWKCLKLQHIAGIKNLIAIREPGHGGDTFIQKMGERLATIGWRGVPSEISLPTKDLSELHIETFGKVEGPEDSPAFLHAISDARLNERPVGMKPRFKMLSTTELFNTDFSQTFLIKRILVQRQPAICGGRSKTLKTSLMIDLALSLGTGTPFLGEFPAKKAMTWVISGESGEFTIKETALRIAKSKGIECQEIDVHWGFDLPQLSNDDDIEHLEAEIIARGIEVLIVDPAYLCLLAGAAAKNIQASNVFDMGPLLLKLTDIVRRTGVTIILCHHARKGTAGPRGDAFSPPDLEDLAMAGFAEWARQWILVGRREAFVQGSGIHKLWMNVGGSAGHSGCYPLDIDEGHLSEDFTGRTWDVQVLDQGEIKDHQKKAANEKKAAAARETELKRVASMRAAVIKVGETGATLSVLRSMANLTDRAAKSAIEVLEARGEVEACKVIRSNKQAYDGWRATADIGTVPDQEDEGDMAYRFGSEKFWSNG